MLIMFSGTFVICTSYTYSCGNVHVVKNQLTRLFIATSVWYGLTGLFLMVEEHSGICNVTKFLNKEECLQGGFKWRGFDISGHCFLLVWNNLFMLEEGKAYLGWERIKGKVILVLINTSYTSKSQLYGVKNIVEYHVVTFDLWDNPKGVLKMYKF